MDRAMIERYKEEMMRLSGRKRLATPTVAEPIAEPPITEDGRGKLIVTVTALRSLYPVNGADVTVFTGEGENARVIATDITDQSGRTDPFVLETPPKSVSLDSGSVTLPYALYNVRVRAEGYIDNIHLNVPVFSGTTSIQQSNLMLLETAGDDKRPQVFDEAQQFNLN